MDAGAPLLDLLLFLHLHLLRLLVPQLQVRQQLLRLFLLLALLPVLLALLLLQVLRALHRLQVVVVALLYRFVVLAGHQQ